MTNPPFGTDAGSISHNPFEVDTTRKLTSGVRKVLVGLGAILALGGAYFAGTKSVGGDQVAEMAVNSPPEQTASSSVPHQPGTSNPYYAAGQAVGQRMVEGMLKEAKEASGEGADPVSQPVNLVEGGFVEFSCNSYDPGSGTCMTATLTELNTNARCSNEFSEPGRYVSLRFEATMPSDASQDFYSPFAVSGWSVATESGKWTNAHDHSSCDIENDSRDLTNTFPGYFAEGTAWILVPDDAETLFFSYGSQIVFTVDL